VNRYRHYKGNIYEVITRGKHSETEELMVVYRDTKDPSKVWIRPWHMFLERIIYEGKVVPRFEKLDDSI
jgi:hypothetical protein